MPDRLCRRPPVRRGFLHGPQSRDADRRPFLPYDGAVAVSCTPRQAIAYGRVPDDLATPQVVLDGGRTIRSRRLKLRGEDAWFAFLPDASVRALRAGKHRAALRVPPASAQCGYSVRRHF